MDYKEAFKETFWKTWERLPSSGDNFIRKTKPITLGVYPFETSGTILYDYGEGKNPSQLRIKQDYIDGIFTQATVVLSATYDTMFDLTIRTGVQESIVGMRSNGDVEIKPGNGIDILLRSRDDAGQRMEIGGASILVPPFEVVLKRISELRLGFDVDFH